MDVVGVVVRQDRDRLEAQRLVEGHGRGVVGADLEVDAVDVGVLEALDERCDEGAADAAALGGVGDGDAVDSPRSPAPVVADEGDGPAEYPALPVGLFLGDEDDGAGVLDEAFDLAGAEAVVLDEGAGLDLHEHVGV